MQPDDDETSELLERAGHGDALALRGLLDLHRARLRRLVAIRLDHRLSSRVDPSDIVQEALADASRKLPLYLQHQPLPFYPWLRRLALERLIQARRRHLLTSARSIAREERNEPNDSAPNALLLVDQLVARGTTPSQAMIRDERRDCLQAALLRLAATDREVLIMRYLEELSFSDIAAVLGLQLGAVKMRHLRALQRLQDLLAARSGFGEP